MMLLYTSKTHYITRNITYIIIVIRLYRTYEKPAAKGADKTQAQIIFRIVPHLTAFVPRVIPAPNKVPLAT